jgi:hypothetical protein
MLATARRFNRPVHATKRSTQRPHVNPTNVPRISPHSKKITRLCYFQPALPGSKKTSHLVMRDHPAFADYQRRFNWQKGLEDKTISSRESLTLSTLSSTFLTLVAEISDLKMLLYAPYGSMNCSNDYVEDLCQW